MKNVVDSLVYTQFHNQSATVIIARNRPGKFDRRKVYAVHPHSASNARLHRVVSAMVNTSRRYKLTLTASGYSLTDGRNHGCGKCHGTFEITYRDYVPYGSTEVAMETSEVCDCLWDGCPVCGGKVDEQYHATGGWYIGCVECGWVLK